MKCKLNLKLVLLCLFAASSLGLWGQGADYISISKNQWGKLTNLISDINLINSKLIKELQTSKTQIDNLKLIITNSENLILQFQNQIKSLSTTVLKLTNDAESYQALLKKSMALNSMYKILIPILVPVLCLIVGFFSGWLGYVICDNLYKYGVLKL
jgi:septal ring factor EnvC (AmiA/AmiB activator)